MSDKNDSEKKTEKEEEKEVINTELGLRLFFTKLKDENKNKTDIKILDFPECI